MTLSEFTALVSRITRHAGGCALDAKLEEGLNRAFPADGPVFRLMRMACQGAIADGWMCQREAGGIRFGRVVKPADATHGFSVDVVDMADVVGPHHCHPNGEIDLVMPLEGPARFDGRDPGFVVYGPGSAHRPTVRGGRALVLYLLPGGAIEFTKEASP
jgi:hypothetical protein